MLSVDQVLELHRLSCECSDAIRVKCPNCLMRDVVVTINEHSLELQQKQQTSDKVVKELRTAVQDLQKRHNIHIEALHYYYHLLHKDCPCSEGIPAGKCESPWSTIVVDDGVKKLSRAEEVTQVRKFMSGKKVRRMRDSHNLDN